MATKRLQKEQSKFNCDGCMGGPKGDDLFNWEITLTGPAGTPYEGGCFVVKMDFPSDFPFKPPTVKFDTKIYHCNVNNDGTICLDILKDAWSPKIDVNQIMTSLCALLQEANPNDALVPEIADLYKKDRAAHDAKAKEFTQKYAK